MKVSQFTPEQIEKIKFSCQTDLFFLGKEVLGKDFVESPHRAMCDFYVKKNPKVRFKEFGMTYGGSRDRIQLVPRETYKSSIKVVDNTQWLICYPEIRILTVTAAIDLANSFIDEFTRYFTVRGKAERNPATNLVVNGRPTFFQELFPEHCVTETEANTGEFTSPARKSLPANLIFKEPTAGTLSMGGTTSGWHCDVLDYDDPVSDRNSETGNQLDKLDDRLAMVYELLMNYGFRHTVATRYDLGDPYYKLAEAHGIKELYGDFEQDGLKYMCRPCLWLKGQPYKQPNYADGFPEESDVDLFFPEGSPYYALRKKFKNAKTFFSQQLNSPTDPNKNPFTEEMIRSCMVDHSALPKKGDVFIAWDLAISISKMADYTVGVVGLLDLRGEWWIIDIVRGRFNWSECPYQIVKAMQEHRPRRTAIEEAMGARNLTESIDRHGREMKVNTEIDWISLGKGTDDAKFERIITLHPWFVGKRIHILNTIECMDDLVREFMRIGNKRSKDDIPDAMSRLVLQYSNLSIARSLPTPDEALKEWNAAADEDAYNLIFGQGKYAEGSEENQRLMVGRDGKFWSPNTQTARDEPEGFVDSMTGLPSAYPI